MMFFKPEKRVLFISVDFSFRYTPNCTVSRSNFQKFSGEGLTEPSPQTPPPAFSRASPSVRASPSILGRFAPLDSGLRPRFSPPKKLTYENEPPSDKPIYGPGMRRHHSSVVLENTIISLLCGVTFIGYLCGKG